MISTGCCFFLIIIVVLIRCDWEKTGTLSARRGEDYRLTDECYEYTFDIVCDDGCDGYTMNGNDIEHYHKDPDEPPEKYETHIKIRSGPDATPMSTYEETPYIVIYNKDSNNPTKFKITYKCQKSASKPKNAGEVVLFILLACCICCSVPFCTVIAASIKLTCIVGMVYFLVELAKKSSDRRPLRSTDEEYEINHPDNPPVYSQDDNEKVELDQTQKLLDQQDSEKSIEDE